MEKIGSVSELLRLLITPCAVSREAGIKPLLMPTQMQIIQIMPIVVIRLQKEKWNKSASAFPDTHDGFAMQMSPPHPQTWLGVCHQQEFGMETSDMALQGKIRWIKKGYFYPKGSVWLDPVCSLNLQMGMLWAHSARWGFKICCWILQRKGWEV